MKSLLLALSLLPLSASAIEVKELRVVRALDGNLVRCVADREVNQVSYSLSQEEAGTTDSALLLAFDVDFVLCSKEGTQFGFTARKPLDSIRYTDRTYGEVRIDMKDPQFYITNEGFYTLLVAPAVNESHQRASFVLPWGKVLSSAERQNLERGKEVKVRLEFLSSAIRSYTLGGQTKPLGRRSDGRFSLFLTLQK